jgi:hypothetical protein
VAPILFVFVEETMANDDEMIFKLQLKQSH